MIISPCDEILTTAASIVSYNQPADRYLLSIDISTRWHFSHEVGLSAWANHRKFYRGQE